jgi:MFS family permease
LADRVISNVGGASASGGDDVTSSRFPRIVLMSMVLGASVVMASVTSVIAITPLISRDLGATQAEIQLIVDVTAVALAALVLPMGALLDRFGRRRGLVVGFGGMIAALVWCYVADSPGEMIAARIATGTFAAVAFPGTLATLTATTPREQRSRAIGAWAGATMVGGTYALLIAGAFGEWGDWRGVFLALAAIVGACLLGTLIAVPETRDPKHANIDPLGALLSLIGVGALTLAVIQMPVHGIDDPVVSVGLALGCLALALFLAWELRARTPMLEVRLFRNSTFSTAVATGFLLFFASYGWFFLSFQYYVYVLGFSPLGAAAGLIPNAVVTVPCAVFGPAAVARFGWRRVIVAVLLIGAASFAFMGIAGQWMDFVPIALGFALFGVCLGTPQGPVAEAIVNALPRAKQGIASAVNDVSRELGAAFGIAVFGSVFNAAYRAEVADYGGSAPAQALDAVKDSPALGAAAADQVGGAVGSSLNELVERAAADGWTAAFFAAAGVFVVAAVLVRLYGPETIFVAERLEPSCPAEPGPGESDGAGESEPVTTATPDPGSRRPGT